MSKIDKLEQKLRSNPKAGWTINDLRRISDRYGIEYDRPEGGGSHETFSHPDTSAIATVVDHGKLKTVYVKVFLALRDAVKGVQ